MKALQRLSAEFDAAASHFEALLQREALRGERMASSLAEELCRELREAKAAAVAAPVSHLPSS